MKIFLESEQHFPCQRTYVTVTGRIDYKNEGWLEKGQRGRKKDLIATGEFFVLDVISFSNIFRGFHHEIQEEVSFDSTRVLLDFSLTNLAIRENRSTKLFRIERSRTAMRSLTSGQKITSESHKELREGCS